jgi:DNA mismatch repair protein MutS2
MNDHTLRVLEFGAIRALLAEQAACALGRERAEAVAPLTDPVLIRRRQQETTQAALVLDRAGQIPLGGIRDIRPAVHLAVIEGLLEPPTLLTVGDTLAAGRQLRAFLLARGEEAPALADLARCISEFPAIEAAIAAAISDHGEVRDEASATLARLRKEMRVLHNRLTERLQSMLRSPGTREMIQEPIVTTRGDRYCLPVKAEFRVQFGGLVHDQSSSGATVFMEPTAVVELGNELRQLAIRERQEIERILRELSGRIGSAAPALRDTLAALAELDFIVARARLSLAQDASEPAFAADGAGAPALRLRRARHPLLRGAVVPIDVELGDPARVLVITGPNTGGKTVSLKTVGLLVLMAQSGLHIPADSGSVLPRFDGVFADIGDEQSIQQSLSTFSGHITHIAAILNAVAGSARSLVLLDEVGAGTDPTEGAALAKSILRHLLEAGVYCIATTHYGELKEFAYTHAGVENASVEFDLETLQPTYRLLIGIPGSSNAFTIAARLGLPAPVIGAARGMIGTDQAQMADVIERLTQDQRQTEEHRRQASRAAAEVEALRARYEQDLERLRTDREETRTRVRSEAERLARQARQEVSRLLEELRRLEGEAREASAGGSAARVARLREQVRQAARETEERLAQPAAAEAAEELPSPGPVDETVRVDAARRPERGDLVWIPTLNQRGTLLEEPDNGRAQVQVGAIRMTLPYGALQRIMAAPRRTPAARPGGAARRGSTAATEVQLQARANIASEIHLRGQHVEEALRVLDDYLDDAVLAGLASLRIVHGKGTGTLRRAVWDWLQSHPHVAEYRLGEDGEGGGGVTVVRLKE